MLLLAVPTVFAQQTGSISGRVTADGQPLPGVTVEASSNVLPQPRVTVTDGNGAYRLPALQPGVYTVSYTLSGMQAISRRAQVLLSDDTGVDVTMGVAGLAETITVTAEATLVDRSSATIQSSLSNEQMTSLPVGQEYRDLVKLAPGIMYTEDGTRGPSAGGSGQDNVYQFDGVNVTLPLYGTLAAEPATHDIAQLSVIKGGAKAIDFNRSGGFTIDSISKSGTNQFKGEVGFQYQSSSMTSELKRGTNSIFDEDRSWGTANIGGPLVADRLFFYGSYYRPTRARENRANLYGDLPAYDSTRNEYFGKLTYTPTAAILLNGSYRASDRLDQSNLFGSAAASTTGTGGESNQKIGTLEASWVSSPRSYFTAKFTDYTLETQGRPDNLADVQISTALGTRLGLANLGQIGLLSVPVPSTVAAVQAFRAPFIDRFGFLTNGVRTGGGLVGFGTTFDKNDFFRTSGQVGFNYTLGTKVTHDLHAGYQRYEDSEDLTRSTNGWGLITIPGGATTCPATICGTAMPIFFQTSFQQQTTGAVPTIHSEYHSQNFEINDSFRWRDWAFNIGVIASNDTLYGQGLQEADNIAGFVSSPGTKYEMYNIPFEKMIQPRLGATWAYNGSDTVYASYATYNPAATSLPRAASWDRNLATTIRAYFDANGALIGTDPLASSSGKLFVDDLDPRTTKEYMIGTAQQFTSRWSARFYARHRYTDNFWEDTNNNARVAFNPPEGVPRELYIANLDALRRAIGRGSLSGSTYVIAMLDGAFTKYYEATLESDYRASGGAFVRGTYTWSHYYGNMDQDGSTGCPPCDDQNTFIGSSNIADGAGRQIWDNKYGDLHGDRRHILKVYGAYPLPWRASAGAYGVYQSGEPWEKWDYEFYRPLVGTSTSDTIRYAEPAGSRKTDAHYQFDLKYTQDIPVASYNFQIVADMFNILDNQTIRKVQPSVHSAAFGQPVVSYSPRRLQLAVRFQF